jgi:hypothetical protein
MKQKISKSMASLGYKNKKAKNLAIELVELPQPFLHVNKNQISEDKGLLIHCAHSHLNTLIDLYGIKESLLLYFDENKQFTGAIAVNKKARQVYQVLVQQRYVLLVQGNISSFTSQLSGIQYL